MTQIVTVPEGKRPLRARVLRAAIVVAAITVLAVAAFAGYWAYRYSSDEAQFSRLWPAWTPYLHHPAHILHVGGTYSGREVHLLGLAFQLPAGWQTIGKPKYANTCGPVADWCVTVEFRCGRGNRAPLLRLRREGWWGAKAENDDTEIPYVSRCLHLGLPPHLLVQKYGSSYGVYLASVEQYSDSGPFPSPPSGMSVRMWVGLLVIRCLVVGGLGPTGILDGKRHVILAASRPPGWRSHRTATVRVLAFRRDGSVGCGEDATTDESNPYKAVRLVALLYKEAVPYPLTKGEAERLTELYGMKTNKHKASGTPPSLGPRPRAMPNQKEPMSR
jgi:hypothetical protein